MHDVPCRLTYPPILYTSEFIIILFGDHESGKVGGITGSEHHSEQCPDVRHKAAGHSSGVICVHCCPKQHRPDQPKRTEQGEAVFCSKKEVVDFY